MANRIEQTLAKLTTDDKVSLVSGASAWRTKPVSDAQVPVLKVSDGPNGVRGDGGVSAASFPVGICLASTWNNSLIERLGVAIAEEAKSKQVHVVLGPTINLHRTPLGGRNFECYSEDPVLSGLLASAFTKGVQSQGIGACLKHFVCNESEFERHTISSVVDERTLRELYLKPFQLAIENSKPWTVMAAYNRINGVYACSHDYLINDVLKGEWQFNGLVMSDWYAAKEGLENAQGGLDLEMPGPSRVWGAALSKYVADGLVSPEMLDDKVRRLLRVMDWAGILNEDGLAPEARSEARSEQALDQASHRKVAYELAVEGMVLLKNDGVLPLVKHGLKKLALIGPNVKDFRIMGGGSSALKPHYQVSPLEALRNRLPECEIETAAGCLTHKYIPAPDRACITPALDSGSRGLKTTFYKHGLDTEILLERVIPANSIRLILNQAEDAPEPESVLLEGFYIPTQTGIHEFGIHSTGKAKIYLDGELLIDNWTEITQGEAFFDQASTEKRTTIDLQAEVPVAVKIVFEADVKNSFRAMQYGILPPQPDASIDAAVKLAADADAVVLIVGTNDDWETEGSDRADLDLPGDQDELIRAVLAQHPNAVIVNNSGSPIAMPWLDDAKAVMQSWFPGQEFGNALADLLLGDKNPSGKLPITFPQRLQDTPAYTNYPGEFGEVKYGEGLFIGYRWFDSRDIEPMFPFGHGLSYAQFTYSNLSVHYLDDGSWQLGFDVSNSSDLDGKETSQVYVHPIDAEVTGPEQELKHYVKTELKAGETKSISLTITRDDFSYWHTLEHRFVTRECHHEIRVASSSRDIRLRTVID